MKKVAVAGLLACGLFSVGAVAMAATQPKPTDPQPRTDLQSLLTSPERDQTLAASPPEARGPALEFERQLKANRVLVMNATGLQGWITADAWNAAPADRVAAYPVNDLKTNQQIGQWVPGIGAVESAAFEPMRGKTVDEARDIRKQQMAPLVAAHGADK